ncbi:MAG: MMPL family transporter, partial [Actinobacteria bacterium]|nr:MMPL family transporter [Actinomycetota bacterium]
VPGAVAGLDLRVPAGSALVLTGRDDAVRRTVALAVAGRIPAEGRLRVAGHLLPARAAWVRAHVGCVLVEDATRATAGSADPLRELREALRGRTTLVVIDGADRLTLAQSEQASAMLRDAADRGPLAVAATTADAPATRRLLADAGWTDPRTHDLDAPPPAMPESAASTPTDLDEVTA